MKLFSKTLTIIKKSAHKILWLERLVLNFKRKINRRKKVFYSNILGLFQNKHGLEIGGPSKIFNPIYDIANSIDGVNHGETIWQGTVVKGAYNGTGKQYIAEGTELIPEFRLYRDGFASKKDEETIKLFSSDVPPDIPDILIPDIKN